MKKAIVILYVLLAVQTCCVVFGFMVCFGASAKFTEEALLKSAAEMGKEMIKVCDQRYVQK